jgi:hypothetical protein
VIAQCCASANIFPAIAYLRHIIGRLMVNSYRTPGGKLECSSMVFVAKLAMRPSTELLRTIIIGVYTKIRSAAVTAIIYPPRPYANQTDIPEVSEPP